MPKISELYRYKLALKVAQSHISDVESENARLIGLSARTAKRTTTEVVNVCEYMAIADRLSAIEKEQRRIHRLIQPPVLYSKIAKVRRILSRYDKPTKATRAKR